MTNKNQTTDNILKKVVRQPDVIKGVGIFVIRSKGELAKQIVPRLTYSKTIDLGKSCVAFKFIPYGENVRIDNKNYRLTSIRSIPQNLWRCIGKCTEEIDCKHLSEVCICAEGECL